MVSSSNLGNASICKNKLRIQGEYDDDLCILHSSRKPSLQACTLDVDELLSKCKPIVVVHLQESIQLSVQLLYKLVN